MTRRHDIDALRILAFGLLILYHVGMLYVAPVADWGFHLKSVHLAEWLEFPMLFVNRWRMELIFLISGLAVHFMHLQRLRDGALKLAWVRSVRLLLPLLFGMLVVIPVQPYVEGLSHQKVAPGFGVFVLHYWSLSPWPEGAFAGSRYGLTWNHLWYLPYLWVYTIVLLGLLPALESRTGKRLRAACLRLRGAGLLWLPGLPLFAAAMLLRGNFPMTHALVGDWYAHALYASVFFYGYLIGVDAGMWAELARLRRTALLLALVSFTVYLFLDKFAGDLLRDRPIDPDILTVAGWLITWLRYWYGWLAIVAILGWGHVLLNRPFRWLPYARQALYPWYILHQSLLLWLAWVLMPLQLGPVIEPALILLGTLTGCAALHELLIRRVGWFAPLFGLKRSEARPSAGPYWMRAG